MLCAVLYLEAALFYRCHMLCQLRIQEECEALLLPRKTS